MKLFRNILGYRDFHKFEDFKDYLVENSYQTDSINRLILFSTTKQKTWIITNREWVFCFLDDISKDTFELRWKDKKALLRNEININHIYKEKTGIINFGENHKQWLYSKDLFSTQEVLNRKIKELIR